MSVDVPAIVEGLEAELAAASQPVRLTIRSRESLGGGVWAFGVEVGRDEARFDETLEAARAYWPGGGGDVSAVVTDPPAVHVRFVTSRVPPVGDYLWLYPPRFLEPLLRVWQREGARDAGEAVLAGCRGEGESFRAPEPPGGLRARQREAFALVAHATSFLDGPPGTGKTYTLGALLASAIGQGVAGRVLLVSTTNAAVDLALRSADDVAAGAKVARRFVRSGYHYAPERYLGREHLLPAGASRLLAALAAVHARKPGRSDGAAFAAWRAEEADARRRLRAHATEARRGARLVAMTVASAVSLFDELAGEGFDLIAFDEASQVGRAAGLAVAQLGRRAIFAGDPRQLGPVVVADDAGARRWLGTSMFLHRTSGAPNACFLDEQSRMAPAVCGLVSSTFYGATLRVAAASEQDPAWRAARRLDRPGFEPLVVRSVEPGGGRVRASSAKAAVELAAELAGEGFGPGDLLVLTPFRRQREALRAALDGAGLGGVEVSTVHRAQGGEAPVVVFDPVDEASDFLSGEDGLRLINVALSRAQAKLVLLIAPAKLREAHFFRVLVDGIERPSQAADGDALFRLPDLAPLVASGVSLLGAKLALGAGRSCEILSWDERARRGEAVDSAGRIVAVAAPAPVAALAPAALRPPAAPGAFASAHAAASGSASARASAPGSAPAAHASAGGWLERFVARTLGARFAAGFPLRGHAERAATVARIHAAASASRLRGLRGFRGELDLALALEARGRNVIDVSVRARLRSGAALDVDVVTAAGGAVAFLASTSPATRSAIEPWAEAARALVAHERQPLRSTYCYCAAGFDGASLALLRARGVVPLADEAALDAVR